MNTRRAAPESAFRQERYMSSPELERGLKANCVASRVRVLARKEQRELIWFLQHVSHTPGGIAEFADSIIQKHPERFATRQMQRLGFASDRIYSGDEIKEIRAAHHREFLDEFRLKGEGREMDALLGYEGDYVERWSLPEGYAASVLIAFCIKAAKRGLADFLFKEFALNPAVKIEDGLWYCPDLEETLLQAKSEWIAARRSSAPVTSIGTQVHEALDFAIGARPPGHEDGRLVIVSGVTRTGKTFSVRQWAAERPGVARYIQVPSSTDEISFLRAIGLSLGLGSCHAYKTVELRERIESVVQDGDLVLIFDEAHFLWGLRPSIRRPMPHRINWILLQLVNMGVNVAFVSTEQFAQYQAQMVKAGNWAEGQLNGRAHRFELPRALPAEELHAIARFFMPYLDEETLLDVVALAEMSDRYLQAIESISQRAQFRAEKAGRASVTAEDAQAVIVGEMQMIRPASQPAPRRQKQATALPLQARRTDPAETLQEAAPRARQTAPEPLSHHERGTDTATLLAT